MPERRHPYKNQSAPRRGRGEGGAPRYLPLHAALQVGHGELSAGAALEVVAAEALHEALLGGAALPCNTAAAALTAGPGRRGQARDPALGRGGGGGERPEARG